MHGTKRTAKLAIAGLVLLALASCTSRYRSHGYMPPEEDLQQIVPGIDTRASVEDVIGVPTASGVLRDSGYYYIESEVRHFAWKRPEVVTREVLAITFDEAGVVDNLVTYGLEDGKVVPLNRRVTQSGDGDIGFIRKLFGNIGGLSTDQLFGG
ncbi:outer membrane protein assembly factor BamE [uncultured Pelagimonas sp.]|uniref:outer membrane protein assembly factor BamE n=1 Tax=uncultured Pelagimonas sp. TaxID=1618102 RepID=UPI0026116439|nr:outer membrane protein assembly factor BamE [uncultured Pelagimonas sp.]